MNTKEIYLAGGCFWGTEHFIKLINGVISTQVGYANGTTSNPTYKEVCTGTTGHAETVKVIYDPIILSLNTILELYFKTIDPTSINSQAKDKGVQYRTGIYYTCTQDIPVIETAIEKLGVNYNSPIAIEVKSIENFFAAEDYHQQYLNKNSSGYCHIHPDLFELAKGANKEKR